MSWTDIAVAPVGPVYFGDGRPMAAGETDFGDGRFPPSGRTMQGIVRTTLLRSVPGLALGSDADPDRIETLVGPPERLPDGWQIAGPWLACWREAADGTTTEVEPWLPLPLYVARRRQSREDTPPAGQADLAALTSLPLPDRMRWDSDRKSAALAEEGGRPVQAYVGPRGLCRLLAGAPPAEDEVRPDWPDFVAQEPRVGLRIVPDREVAEEGMLYTLGYRRLREESGFVLRFRGELREGTDAAALTRGVTSIGGKTRLARLLRLRSWSEDFEKALGGNHLPAEPAEGARFWLWTTTPVPLERPWAPGPLAGPETDAKVSIVTAVVGRAVAIGGFSLAARRSQDSVACVPAGSSWLIELEGGSPAGRAALLRSLHDAFPLQSDPALKAMGFGHTLVSTAPDQRSR